MGDNKCDICEKHQPATQFNGINLCTNCVYDVKQAVLDINESEELTSA